MNETTMHHELLDSGMGEYGGEKLERFGQYILRRPDPEVLWKKMKGDDVWNAADAEFVLKGVSKKWKMREEIPEDWITEVGGLKFKLDFGAFKHVGMFPEQEKQWEWMAKQVESRKSKVESGEGEKKIKILNLFGYTGGATLALAHAGCEVTHVDALESNLLRTKENLVLNNLADAPVRLIADDVRKFVEREIKRGVRYDGILMDPPVYGKGTEKQKNKHVWHLEEDLLPLLTRTAELLSDEPLFFVISGYASQYSHITYNNALTDIFAGKARVESGELAIKEVDTQRLLPAGIFARAYFG